MRLYSSFFALVNRMDNEEIGVYKNILEERVQNYTSADYWSLFGYVYLGSFVLSGCKREELLNRFDQDHHYAKDIFTALYYRLEFYFTD